ncbi:hypothetical protein ACFX59_17510 [Sphingomonas sp. NCPPB 2930]|uniref:hypothetical protein n=1 Tax=Sphingomonas sp. NCPPB 2930 TaxID=3162788 RepID=UPI0036DC0337
MRHFTVLVRLAPITVGLASASVIAAKANDHSSDVVPPQTVSERAEAKTGDTGSVTKPVAFAKRATVHERGQGEGHAHVGRSNAAVTVLSEIDAGHIRDLPSRPVTIHLPGNPSTGYAWNVLRV